MLFPHSAGFDEKLIADAQKTVARNENISQEIVNLIQVSYGGQSEVFTDESKSELSERIYYLPGEPSDIYNKIYQASWQQQIDIFSPIVESTAEARGIILFNPQSEIQRNQLLSDFIAQQMKLVYEQSNGVKLNDTVTVSLAAEYLQLGSKSSSDNQLNRITEDIAIGLGAPGFGTELDAAAFELLQKSDEEINQTTELFVTKMNETRELDAESSKVRNFDEVESVQDHIDDDTYDDDLGM